MYMFFLNTCLKKDQRQLDKLNNFNIVSNLDNYETNDLFRLPIKT